jgi:hypothetical protein
MFQTQKDNDKQRNSIDNGTQSTLDSTKIISFDNNTSFTNNFSESMSLNMRKSKNSNGSNEPQTLIGKEIEKEFPNNNTTQNNSNYNR